MTDNELLLAISDMMDKKLDAKITPLDAKIQSVTNDVQIIKADIANIKARMDILETRMDAIEAKMDILEAKMDAMETRMDTMEAKIDTMEAKISSMNDEITSIKIFQENVILPRLDTIESCYIDTYDRYRNNADKMESVFDDMDILKRVVTEHSIILQSKA